jgi:hypothetical protein
VDGALTEASVSLSCRPSTSRQALSGGNPTAFSIAADQYPAVNPQSSQDARLSISYPLAPSRFDAFGRKGRLQKCRLLETRTTTYDRPQLTTSIDFPDRPKSQIH